MNSVKLTRAESKAWLQAQIELADEYAAAVATCAAAGEPWAINALAHWGTASGARSTGGPNKALIAIKAMQARTTAASMQAAAKAIFQADDSTHTERVHALKIMQQARQVIDTLDAIAPGMATHALKIVR